jgi:hypothetical protein
MQDLEEEFCDVPTSFEEGPLISFADVVAWILEIRPGYDPDADPADIEAPIVREICNRCAEG